MKKLRTLLSCLVTPLFLFVSCSNSSHSAKATVYNSFYPSSPVKASLPTSAKGKDKHGFPNYSIKDMERFVRTTAYSDAENEPGAVGNLNAAGTTLKYGNVRSAAADWSIYPLGTKFKIKGLPHTYIVDDYGSALVGTNTVDIYHPSLKLMRKWGTRPVELNIIEMGDWHKSAKLLKGRTKYAHCNSMYCGVMSNLRQFKDFILQNN